MTGVDISPRQVERARAAIPEAEFLCADFTELELPADSLDAAVAFYTFNHVPRELLAPLLASAYGWLVPGGWLMVAFGTSDNPGWTGEWLGAPRRSSRASRRRSTRGSSVRPGSGSSETRSSTWEEPEGPARFQWVLAQA